LGLVKGISVFNSGREKGFAGRKILETSTPMNLTRLLWKEFPSPYQRSP
jgi:hypothetical protein